MHSKHVHVCLISVCVTVHELHHNCAVHSLACCVCLSDAVSKGHSFLCLWCMETDGCADDCIAIAVFAIHMPLPQSLSYKPISLPCSGHSREEQARH